MNFVRTPQLKLLGAILIVFGNNASFAQLDRQAFNSIDFSITVDQQLTINSNDGSTQKNQTTIQPRWDADLSDSTSLTAIGRARLDTEAKLGFSGSNAHVDLELRELYIDAEWAGAYWRLGKQQIVWGQADGLRVLDVINPVDLREFILPEFEDHRIPLWTANVEISLNEDWTAQLLLIPDQTYDELPDRDASFAIRSPLLIPTAPAGIPVTLGQTDRPQRLFKDADAGARLSAFLGGWDVSLNYLYHYQDQPVLYQLRDESGITLAPAYERTHLLGGSFSNVFGDTTFRAELGYSSDRFFLSDDGNDSDGIVSSGEISYVLGLDYQGWRDWFVSAQIFQSIVTDDGGSLVRDSVDTTATFLARRYFLNESVQAEALFIQSLNNDDGVLQASLEYEWSSNIRINIGADIFFGSSKGLFGQFKEKDRVSAGIEFGY